MIVSASYRTDIPAFYGAWFLNRFRAGFARVVNPYGGKPSLVPLRQGVRGYVFWTRNAAPFLPVLDVVAEAGLPSVIQYTVTGNPRALETSVVAAERSVAVMRQLAERYGRRAVVWRYDPIVVSALTPPEWHRANFSTLAAALEGVVDEVVVSFVQLYRKTARHLAVADRAAGGGLGWRDPPPDEKVLAVRALAGIAARHGISLSLCTQPELAAASGLPATRCIDAQRLSDLAGSLIPARAKGNRPGCLCAESRDIGAYDTCPHGCVYCYAVGSRTLAKRRARSHDPQGEYLFSPSL